MRIINVNYHIITILLTIFVLAYGIPASASDAPASDPEFDTILSMDISDLTVTSVSKREQKINDTAAAIYVITQEDLQRTGATSIPEALRMVPGLDVARTASNQWAISARGFNGVLANKLLVLLDGRTVYSPVFSGTYWDDQSTPIQDIDRIEVIRGPGASIYGANAVDGVINIITKSARETQNNQVSATLSTGGSLVDAHHGGAIDDNNFYRVYGEYLDAGDTKNPSGGDNHDAWDRMRAGFRMDGDMDSTDNYTLQGDFYGGHQDADLMLPILAAPYSQSSFSDNTSYGGNVIGRWNHDLSNNSQLSMQAYIDHYTREELNATQHVSTADVSLQNTVHFDDRNNFVWGGGVRLINEDLLGTYEDQFSSSNSNHEILNVFAQDEYAIIPRTLFLTLGSKLEYNDYTGIEVEPTSRLSWHFADNQMAWAAISRAVRTPSTYEENISALAEVVPTSPLTELRLLGNPNQESEDLIAYELGHRIQATKDIQFDTALYYNEFTHLQTIGIAGSPYTVANGDTVIPYTFDNLGSGNVYGAEFTANWNVTPRWRLSGSYSYSKMSLDVNPGSAITLDPTQSLDPRNQFSARSYLNVTDNVHWDNMVYFVDNITGPAKAYVRYDTRVSWMALHGVELSLVGRNLFEPIHAEFPATPQAEIGPSVLGQIVLNF